MSGQIIAFPQTKKLGPKMRRGPCADLISIAPQKKPVRDEYEQRFDAFLLKRGIGKKPHSNGKDTL
jgi:hypothetical protein